MLVTYTDAQALIWTVERGKKNLLTRSQERLIFLWVSSKERRHATFVS